MQMEEGLVERIRGLLAQAKSVHIQYEKEVLGGAYDEAWPRWYAMYLLENGLPEVLAPQDKSILETNRLADLLSEMDLMQRTNAPDADWMDYYARYLIRAGSGEK
jgi:hypothetical protein